MAVTLLYNAFVSINGVDYSSKGNEIAIPLSTVEHDATTWGNATVIHEPGLKMVGCTMKFFNDHADNAMDEALHTIWALAPAAGCKVANIIRVDAGVIGVTNPEWRFTGFIKAWNPLSGKVGDLVQSTLEWSNTTAIARAVA